MKNTIKALVNQVKKAIDNRASFPTLTKAYADSNGALIARNLKDADIFIFVAGIVEDVAKREKLYNKDALTLAADTGIFANGSDLPENSTDIFTLPAEDFRYITSISAEDIKAAATTASKNNTRPVLQAVYINGSSMMLESCDGFRAYRKKLVKAVDIENLDNKGVESKGLIIHAAALVFGFKGDIAIYNGDKYIKLVDDTGLTIYTRKIDAPNYIDLDAVYTRNYSGKIGGAARIKDVKTFASILKTAINANGNHRSTIILKARQGFIDYFVKELNLFGSIEADTTTATPDGYNMELNPRYVYDAVVNQACNFIEFSEKSSYPAYISSYDGAKALVLPIRNDGEYYFTEYDASQAAPEAPAEVTAEAVTPEAPANVPEKEAEAIARINERQNKENHFVNISREDVKQEMEAPADDPETETPAETTADISATISEKLEIVKREEMPPEVKEARAIYRRLKSCGFTPTEYQEADAILIFKNNRDKLAPIARKAGGLYIDTLAIIAAIMTIHEELI